MSRMTLIFSVIFSFCCLSNAHASSSEGLYYASKGGYIAAAKNLIEKNGAGTNFVHSINGETALFAAVERNNMELVEYLIKNNANIDRADSNGTSPLHVASRAGNLRLVEYLIGKGATVDSTDSDGATPLHESAAAGHFDVFRHLIIKGANTESKTISGWIPLHHAARFGHTRLVSTLLYRGSPMYLRNDDGNSIFDLATIAGHDNVLVFLKRFIKAKQ